MNADKRRQEGMNLLHNSGPVEVVAIDSMEKMSTAN
jgi:hypothetical protein